jgi:phospholipase C
MALSMTPPRRVLAALLGMLVLLAVPFVSVSGSRASESPALEDAIEHIQHVIFVVQENRSFDHYFGTYPGADGIPMNNDVPTVCVPDRVLNECVKPYHSTNPVNLGGPHTQRHSVADVDGGKMDGFVETAIASHVRCAEAPKRFSAACATFLGPQKQPDVMGWHDAREIPNYWAYAEHFGLQDHMFAPSDSWTLPSHLYLVSAWSASCTNPKDPMTCSSDLQLKEAMKVQRGGQQAIYGWTDITYLLAEAGVSWAYYVGDETCFLDPCTMPKGSRTTRPWQNPLPGFVTVRQDHQLSNIQGHDPTIRVVGHAVLRRLRASRERKADLERAGLGHEGG